MSAFLLSPFIRTDYWCRGKVLAAHIESNVRTPRWRRLRSKLYCDATEPDQSPPPPPFFDTEDPLSRITKLQEALDDAVAAEQFSSAAAIRDKLHEATNEDSVQILEAVLNYYEAFSEQDVNRIRHLWLDRHDVICQHPLIAPYVGYHNVVSGYNTLFKTLPTDFTVTVSDVRISSHGASAYVTCTELPRSKHLAAEEQANQGRAKWHGLLSTKIFEKVWNYRRQNFQYLLVHHVSTPILKGNGV